MPTQLDLLGGWSRRVDAAGGAAVLPQKQPCRYNGYQAEGGEAVGAGHVPSVRAGSVLADVSRLPG